MKTSQDLIALHATAHFQQYYGTMVFGLWLANRVVSITNYWTNAGLKKHSNQL